MPNGLEAGPPTGGPPAARDTTRGPEARDSRETVVNAFNRSFSLFEQDYNNNLLSPEERWQYESIRDAKTKTLDQGRGTFLNEFENHHTGETLTQREGIPVENVLAFLTKKIDALPEGSPEREELEQAGGVLYRNSKPFHELSHRMEPSRLLGRVHQEALFISEDVRSTGTMDGDWYKAEGTLNARRELILPARGTTEPVPPEPEPVPEPTPEPNPNPEEATPPEEGQPPENIEPQSQTTEEIRYDAAVTTFDEQAYKKAGLLVEEWLREEQRRGSIFNPIAAMRKLALNVGEDYFRRKNVWRAVEAMRANHFTNLTMEEVLASTRIVNGRVQTQQLNITPERREAEQKDIEAQLKRTQLAMRGEHPLIESEQIKDAPLELRQNIIANLFEPFVRGEITSDEFRERQQELFNEVRNNPDLADIFGPTEDTFGEVRELFADNLLATAELMKADYAAHRFAIERIDEVTNISFANLRWQQHMRPNFNWIDRRIMDMQRTGRGWLINPATAGAVTSLATFGISSLLGKGSNVFVPGSGLLAGAAFSALKRVQHLKMDRAMNVAERVVEGELQIAPAAPTRLGRLRQTFTGERRRAALEERRMDFAPVDQLLSGGGRAKGELEDRRGLRPLLAEMLADDINDPNLRTLVHEVAEVETRLNYPGERGEDLISFSKEITAAQGRLELVEALIEARRKLNDWVGTDDLKRQVVDEMQRDQQELWQRRFFDDQAKQERGWNIYLARNAAGAAVFGGAVGMASGLVVQEGLALAGRAAGMGVGPTVIEQALGFLGERAAVGPPSFTAFTPDVGSELFQNPGNLQLNDKLTLAVDYMTHGERVTYPEGVALPPDQLPDWPDTRDDMRAVSFLDNNGQKIEAPPFFLRDDGALVSYGELKEAQNFAKLDDRVEQFLASFTRDNLGKSWENNWFNIKDDLADIIQNRPHQEGFVQWHHMMVETQPAEASADIVNQLDPKLRAEINGPVRLLDLTYRPEEAVAAPDRWTVHALGFVGSDNNPHVVIPASLLENNLTQAQLDEIFGELRTDEWSAREVAPGIYDLMPSNATVFMPPEVPVAPPEAPPIIPIPFAPRHPLEPLAYPEIPYYPGYPERIFPPGARLSDILRRGRPSPEDLRRRGYGTPGEVLADREEARLALEETRRALEEADSAYVILGGAIGDAVLSTAYLRGLQEALQQFNKDIPITLVVSQEHGDLFDPLAQQNVQIVKAPHGEGLQNARARITQATEKNPLIIDLEHYRVENPFVESEQLNDKKVTTLENLLAPAVQLYNNQTDQEQRFAHYMEELFSLQKDSLSAERVKPTIELPQNKDDIYERLVTRFGIDRDRPQIAIVVESQIPEKRYPMEHWANVISQLSQQYSQLQFNIIYNPSSRARGFTRGDIENTLRTAGVLDKTHLIGTTLQEAAVLFEHQQLVLSNDTGLAHIATAIEGGPFVATLHIPYFHPNFWVANPKKQTGILPPADSTNIASIPTGTVVQVALDILRDKIQPSPITPTQPTGAPAAPSTAERVRDSVRGYVDRILAGANPTQILRGSPQDIANEVRQRVRDTRRAIAAAPAQVQAQLGAERQRLVDEWNELRGARGRVGQPQFQPPIQPETLEAAVPLGAERSRVTGVGFSEAQGPRPTMEDAHTIVENFAGMPNQAFFAVYDGHGGRQVADFASQRLHENLLSLFAVGEPPLDAFKTAYYSTDEQIKEAGIGENTGSTAVTALVLGDRLFVANAGDARAVLDRGGQAMRLSEDHKPADPAERARIERAGGRVLQGMGDIPRVEGDLAVARALGDEYLKRFVPSEPFTREVDLQPGDTHLILACDGVWDVMSDQDAVNLIRNEADPQRASELLKNEALRRGSTDNISVIVVNLSQQPAQAAMPVEPRVEPITEPREPAITEPPAEPVTPTTEPLEATTAADRTRASLDRIGERRRAEREQAVTKLEERFRRGELQLRTPIIVDAVFENQMIYTEASRPLWTCGIATLRNGLKALHAYDETTDTEEHMVREVRGLFDTRGFLDNIALRHLLGNRSERGIDMQGVLFEQAIQRLAEGNGVLLHNSGGNHLVLYVGLQARMVDGENILGVRKVNPLRTPPQSEFVPLRDLLSDVDDYRIMYRRPPSQVRIPRRPTAEPPPTEILETTAPATPETPTQPTDLVSQVNETLRTSTESVTNFTVIPESLENYITTLTLPMGAKVQTVDIVMERGKLLIDGLIGVRVGTIEFTATLVNNPAGGLSVENHRVNLPFLARGLRSQIENQISNLDQLLTSGINSQIDQNWEVGNIYVRDNGLVFDFKRKGVEPPIPPPPQPREPGARRRQT